MKRILLLFLIPVFFIANTALAQEGLNPEFIEGSLFQDFNENLFLEIVAFGDSLTRGVGDFNAPNQEIEEVSIPSQEAGYPLRIELLAGVGVSNRGEPGESLDADGVERFAQLIPATRPDVVIIGGGSNDAREPVGTFEFSTDIQTMINIAQFVGARPVLQTIPPVCCERSFLQGPIDLYNQRIQLLAVVNQIPIADHVRSFRTLCPANDCELLNRPEGLHPNSLGYDVMGETLIATMLGLDLFTLDGQAQLAEALNLPEESFNVIPDDFVPEPPPEMEGEGEEEEADENRETA